MPCITRRGFLFDLDMSQYGSGTRGRVICNADALSRPSCHVSPEPKSFALFRVPPTCATFPFPDQDEAWAMLNFETHVITQPGGGRMMIAIFPSGQPLEMTLRNLGLVLGQRVVPQWAENSKENEETRIPVAAPH